MTGDWNKDSVAYHLLGPTVWLRTGIVRPALDNSHTSFPQIPETLFAVLLATGGDRAPDFSSWLIAGSAVAGGRGSGHAHGIEGDSSLVGGCHYRHHACRLCRLARLLCRWTVRGFRARCCAYCFRCSSDSKSGPSAEFLSAWQWARNIPACLLYSHCWFAARIGVAKQQRFGDAALFKSIGVAFITALAVAAPFYIRNWIILGCPIYPPPPGYSHFCSPRYFPASAISQFHSYIFQRGMGLGRGWLAFLKLPFNLTYHTSNFHGAGGVGLCPLGLAPFGFLALRKQFFARQLARPAPC